MARNVVHNAALLSAQCSHKPMSRQVIGKRLVRGGEVVYSIVIGISQSMEPSGAQWSNITPVVTTGQAGGTGWK